MKDLLIIVAICVVVAGGAWLLLGGGSPRKLFAPVAPQNTVTVRLPDPPPDPKAEKSAAKSRKEPPERRTYEGNAAAAPEQQAPTPSTVAALVHPPANPTPASQIPSRVPASGEIGIGTEGVDVINTFGAPLASAYTVEDGHYIETYFYRGKRTQATIHLRDGKVYSVFPR